MKITLHKCIKLTPMQEHAIKKLLKIVILLRLNINASKNDYL